MWTAIADIIDAGRVWVTSEGFPPSIALAVFGILVAVIGWQKRRMRTQITEWRDPKGEKTTWKANWLRSEGSAFEASVALVFDPPKGAFILSRARCVVTSANGKLELPLKEPNMRVRYEGAQQWVRARFQHPDPRAVIPQGPGKIAIHVEIGTVDGGRFKKRAVVAVGQEIKADISELRMLLDMARYRDDQ